MARVSGWPRLIAVCCIASAALLLFGSGVANAIPSANPVGSCSQKPHCYAGLSSNRPALGIEAVITPLAQAPVQNGFVAGWIGVGGPDDGPNGQAEWLQTGVNTMAGSASELYAEITRPRLAPEYLTLASGIIPGSSYKLTVKQLPGKPNTWQVLVNGTPATDPIYLPESNHFQPMAMSESWNAGDSACNSFDYHFSNVRIEHDGSWHALTDASVLADHDYKVTNRTDAGFTAGTS
jgi:hypothetical protein